VKFNGDDSKTTWENVSQYLAQLGEASVTEEIKVHLFSLSLTDNVFYGLLHYLLTLFVLVNN
jgi:hypothetical protein